MVSEGDKMVSQGDSRVSQGDSWARCIRLKNALTSFNVLKRVVDDAEVSVSVGVARDKLLLSVAGDKADKVDKAADKLREMCQNLRVEEVLLTGKQHLIRYKYITDL